MEGKILVKILSKHVGKRKSYKEDVAHMCSVAIEMRAKKITLLPMYSIEEIRAMEKKDCMLSKNDSSTEFKPLK